MQTEVHSFKLRHPVIIVSSKHSLDLCKLMSYILNLNYASRRLFAYFTANNLTSHVQNLPCQQHIIFQVRDFCRWKEVNCPYERRPRTAEFLLKSGVLGDSELDFESFLCEAPQLQHEKAAFKQMK